MPVNMQMSAREYSFDDAPTSDDQGSGNADAGVAADANPNNAASPQPVICPIETEALMGSESKATLPNALPDPMLRFGAAEFIARGGLIIYPSTQEPTAQPPAISVTPPAVNPLAPIATSAPPPDSVSACPAQTDLFSSGIEAAEPTGTKPAAAMPAGATPIEKPPTGATNSAKDSANTSTLAKSHGTAVPSHDSVAYTAASDYGAQHGFDAEQTNQLAALFAYYHCETPQYCKDVLNSLPFHILTILQAIGGARADGTFDIGYALRSLQEAQVMMNGDPNAANRNLPDGRGEHGVDPMSVQQVGGTHGSTRAGEGQGAEEYANEMSMASSDRDIGYYDFSDESYDTADNTPPPNLDPLPSLPPIETTGPIMLTPPDMRLDAELAPIPAIAVADEANTRTSITDMPDAMAESAANARITNDITNTNPPLTLNSETSQYGRDYGNGVWSYPLETSPLESHNLLATNNADTIRDNSGLISNLSAIYQAYEQGQIGLSDALSMAAGNVRFSANATNADYSVTTRLGGAAQAVGGFVEGLVGLGLSESIIGAVIGIPIAAHGIDNMFAGERTMVEGNHVPPLTVEALEYAGMSPMAAELTNAGLGLVGTVGPGAVRAVVAGRAAQAEEVAANLERVEDFAGAGGNWRVANEVSDGTVVQQANPNNCGPACAEMLLSDRGIGVTQGEIGDGLTSSQSLADRLNSVDSGWTGEGVDISSFNALNQTGSWSAMMWDGGRVGHWVVVDGVNNAGMVMIRDPFNGTSYEMTQADFLNTWSGY